MTENKMKKIIVKFKSGEMKANTDEIIALGGNVTSVLNAINSVVVEMDKDKIETLKKESNIEYIEEDQTAHILGFKDTTYAGIVKKSVQIHTGLVVSWNIEKIHAPDVWNMGYTGKNIKGCIIDTGIDYNHPNLKGAYKGGYDFVTSTNNPYDLNGHGSHVAGIAAARNVGNGTVGVAPDMDIYSYRVLDENGSGSYSNIVSAIQMAIDNGMQIINMSLGGSGYSKAMEDMCKAAYDRGILIVAAAGNAGGDGSQNTIGYPAKYPTVIAVGATNLNDERANFSSVGPELKVSAPGASIVSSVPNGTCKMCDTTGFKSLNGTSMSCPHVFGAAALIMSSDVSLKNDQISNRLMSNSVDLGTIGKDIFFGYGRIDVKAAIDNQTPPPVPPPIQKKYKCSGTPNYQCVEDINGIFNSLEECTEACNKPVEPPQPPQPSMKFSCRELRDGKGTLITKYCAYDSNGEFNSMVECVSKCVMKSKKYSYSYITNTTGKVVGLEIFVDENGLHTSDTVCQIVCSELKVIDSLSN